MGTYIAKENFMTYIKLLDLINNEIQKYKDKFYYEAQLSAYRDIEKYIREQDKNVEDD